jgi:2'-5' RNA ligase
VTRLFVAVWPPPDVVDRLGVLPRSEQRGVRWVSPENCHVTLRFLGEAEPAAVAACLDGRRMPATTAVLGPAVRRLGRGMVVVPVAGLDELASIVGEATAGVGVAPDQRPFRGHVTVARIKSGATCELLGTALHTEFPVTEVTLVRSTLSHHGATYEVVERWSTS